MHKAHCQAVMEGTSRGIGDLPDELMVQVFSYLNPTELNKCSRVCKRWSRLFQEPNLWRHVYATMWSRGQWDYRADYLGHADQVPEYEVYAELLEPMDVMPLEIECFSLRMAWIYFYLGLKRSLQDHLGNGVRVLELSANYFLADEQFNAFISACPNLEELYANYTQISSQAFETSNPDQCLKKLRKLTLSGCTAISDRTIKNLVRCWHAGDSRTVGLRSLSLSGCSLVTDRSLEELSTCPELLVGLEFLDLSGCNFRSGALLRKFVHCCTQLKPANLYYCCNIVTGPYQTSANGCNNLDNVSRACCVQYQN